MSVSAGLCACASLPLPAANTMPTDSLMACWSILQCSGWMTVLVGLLGCGCHGCMWVVQHGSLRVWLLGCTATSDWVSAAQIRCIWQRSMLSIGCPACRFHLQFCTHRGYLGLWHLLFLPGPLGHSLCTHTAAPGPCFHQLLGRRPQQQRYGRNPAVEDQQSC